MGHHSVGLGIGLIWAWLGISFVALGAENRRPPVVPLDSGPSPEATVDKHDVTYLPSADDASFDEDLPGKVQPRPRPSPSVTAPVAVAPAKPMPATTTPGSDPEFTFVKIAPGTFQMGSSFATSDENQHQVTLSQGFEMQTTPVTQSLWENVMGNNPCRVQRSAPSGGIRLLG